MSVLIGLIGSDVAGSLTPPLLAAEAAALGIPCVARPIDPATMPVAGDDWGRLVRLAGEFGFDGVNVTHPAKFAALEAVDEADDDARVLGAVNTVLYRDGRALGRNTDHSGFVRGLRGRHPEADLDDVVLVGAGGAGAAIAYGLLGAGARRVTVVDVDADRVSALGRRLASAFAGDRIRACAPDDVAAAVRSATGLVNATPIGMVGHAATTPIDAALLATHLWVADAVYRPLETPLIRAARAAGCTTIDGGNMAVGQAVDAFRLFTDQDPDASRMRATFLALVEPVTTPTR